MAHRRNELPTPRLATSEKEDQPERQAKRKAAAATLFENPRHLKRPRHARQPDVREATPASISKPRRPKSARCELMTAQSGAMLTAVAATTNGYRKGAASYGLEQLEPVFNELTASVDASGNDVACSDQPSAVSKADREAMIHEHDELFHLLDEEVIATERVWKDGTVARQDAQLGDAVKAFKTFLDTKRSDFDKLFEQLRQIDAEIAATRRDIVATEEEDIMKIKQNWEAALSHQAEEARKARDLTKAAVNQGREEEKKAATSDKKQFDDALNAL